MEAVSQQIQGSRRKDGSKRIADIKVGDEVYSENPETGETGYQRVAQVFVVKTNTILTIKTQNETIETTKPHPFYVIGKGLVAAKDLQVGDHLKMENGEHTVYTLRDPITDDIKYVGRTKNPTSRGSSRNYSMQMEDWMI